MNALDKSVYLRQLDALQVISYRHIELESVRASKAVLLCQHLAGEPGPHVLVKSLGNMSSVDHLAVVALVICLDTGFGYGKIPAVQLLNRL